MEAIVEDTTYQIGKLDAFTQLHVARKLGPSMPIIDGLVRPENKDKDLALLTLMALSQIEDSAADFVITKCLTVVKVKQTNGWASLMDASGTLMFDNTSMGTMLQLTSKVVEVNLGGFFRTALGNVTRAENQPVL